MQLILGSESPRRREILSFFDLHFKQASSLFDEDSIPFENNPAEFALNIAKGKASSLAPLYPEAVILTADTVVYKEGKVFGKPKDLEEAYRFLRELSGCWHSVFTGLTVSFKNQYFQGFEETQVLLNALSDQQIQTYYQKLAYTDKAGGYMIQGCGGIVVNAFKGCYYNVMGLPINTLAMLFKKVGIELWDHLKKT